MKNYYKVLIPILFLGLSSCIVNAPKYSTVEKVLSLKLNMSQDEVNSALGIPPYNFKFMSDSEVVLLYKYRVRDRTTLPFLLKQSNGKKVLGRYVNLMITYDKAGRSKKMESCDDCDETIIEEKKVNIDKVITLLTVTLPIVLVYLGIKIGLK
jgi:hypothetical protein